MEKITACSQIEISPHTVYSQLEDGQAMILELNRKRYYFLNESALFLYQTIEQSKGMTIAQLIERMLDEYDISSEQAAADVHEVIEQMLGRELIILR